AFYVVVFLAVPTLVAVGSGFVDGEGRFTWSNLTGLAEPAIADRLTAVWIGGPEHDGLGLPFPLEGRVEYNLNIDVPAAQAIFNDSRVPVWQVPRDAYRQALVTRAELDARVRPAGALGAFLAERIDALAAQAEAHGLLMGETYCLGDQPLVLLTALQSAFEADPSSSRYAVVPTPELTDEGWYRARPDGRPLRVYTQLDTRLMFEDFYAKLARFAAENPTGA
ncbi:MAG: nucleoside hydrolase, partial [Microbacteriaceae bacterium]|nr:nucleoside hydrolase [Microbacteriaceae bacterium]